MIGWILFSATLAILSFCETPPGTHPQHAESPRQLVPAVQINVDGTVTIKANGLSLQTLLDALSPVCPIDLRIDGALRTRPIIVETINSTPTRAVAEILKASGLDHVMGECGTGSRAMRIAAGESGKGPVTNTAAAPDPDDPIAKDVLLPPLPAGPPPEPEEREDPSSPSTVTIPTARVGNPSLAPGEITGAQLVERLAPLPSPDTTIIEVPFTDASGQPYVQVRPPKQAPVTLPFPDADGQTVEVPASTAPRAVKADFPVVKPGAPATPAPTRSNNPADKQRPPGRDWPR